MAIRRLYRGISIFKEAIPWLYGGRVGGLRGGREELGGVGGREGLHTLLILF
jgi:hypothetical protein